MLAKHAYPENRRQIIPDIRTARANLLAAGFFRFFLAMTKSASFHGQISSAPWPNRLRPMAKRSRVHEQMKVLASLLMCSYVNS